MARQDALGRSLGANLTEDGLVVSSAGLVEDGTLAQSALTEVTKAHTADAVLFLGHTVGHSASAVLLATRTTTQTADAVLATVAVAGGKSHTATAVLSKTPTKSHLASAVLQGVAVPVTFGHVEGNLSGAAGERDRVIQATLSGEARKGHSAPLSGWAVLPEGSYRGVLTEDERDNLPDVQHGDYATIIEPANPQAHVDAWYDSDQVNDPNAPPIRVVTRGELMLELGESTGVYALRAWDGAVMTSAVDFLGNVEATNLLAENALLTGTAYLTQTVVRQVISTAFGTDWEANARIVIDADTITAIDSYGNEVMRFSTNGPAQMLLGTYTSQLVSDSAELRGQTVVPAGADMLLDQGTPDPEQLPDVTNPTWATHVDWDNSEVTKRGMNQDTVLMGRIWFGAGDRIGWGDHVGGSVRLWPTQSPGGADRVARGAWFDNNRTLYVAAQADSGTRLYLQMYDAPTINVDLSTERRLDTQAGFPVGSGLAVMGMSQSSAGLLILVQRTPSNNTYILKVATDGTLLSSTLMTNPTGNMVARDVVANGTGYLILWKNAAGTLARVYSHNSLGTVSGVGDFPAPTDALGLFVGVTIAAPFLSGSASTLWEHTPWENANDTAWLAYSWSDGASETGLSPPASFPNEDHVLRHVSAARPSAGTTQVKLYLAFNNSPVPPALSSYRLLATNADGQFDLTDDATTVAHPNGGATNFPAGGEALLRTDGPTGGVSHELEIHGSGQFRLPVVANLQTISASPRIGETQMLSDGTVYVWNGSFWFPLNGKLGAKLVKGGNQSTGSGIGTFDQITWSLGGVQFDSGVMRADGTVTKLYLDNDRLTMPLGYRGAVRGNLHVLWQNPPANDVDVRARVRRSGSAVLAESQTQLRPGNGPGQSLDVPFEANIAGDGDYIDFAYSHNAAGSFGIQGDGTVGQTWLNIELQGKRAY